MRARVLLELDENARAVPHRRVVAERVGVSIQTVYLIAKQFTASGGDVHAVIHRKKRVTAAGASESDRGTSRPG